MDHMCWLLTSRRCLSWPRLMSAVFKWTGRTETTSSLSRNTHRSLLLADFSSTAPENRSQPTGTIGYSRDTRNARNHMESCGGWLSPRNRVTPSVLRGNLSTEAGSSSGVLGGLARLSTRSLVRVSGKDSAPFLQGLITNDIHLLDASEKGGPQSIYTVMLNTAGRILYDLVVCKPDSDTYLIEQDGALRAKFIQHLKMYKLRKQVVVEDVSDRFHVFSQYAGSFRRPNSPESMEGSDHSVITFVDPRLPLLGSRIFGSNSASDKMYALSNSNETAYRKFRYELGVAEGSAELPPGECFPFESNLDYLSGVHFNKGCYLGQELTARTHHTGVVRKRIMPVKIHDTSDDEVDSLERGSPIVVESTGKAVGKLRAHVGSTGIALLRISEALAADSLVLDVGGKRRKVTATRPGWWPSSD